MVCTGWLIEKWKFNEVEEGGVKMIGWKKAINFGSLKGVIVKLEIPDDAQIVDNDPLGKCRCDRAKVLEIIDCLKLNKRYRQATSIWDCSFKYKVGMDVVPDWFDGDLDKVCSHGIHFFHTLEEALNY